ncbi:MAG: isocitrate lyase/phosphoenolpyruvate mutase family protein [Thiolinea sp.]
MADQFNKSAKFKALHQQKTTFVMPNAWDAGSAKMLAATGFSAIATTSAGIAFALGRPDSEDAVSRVEMLNAIQQIVQAVDLPVSADLEAGFGIEPKVVAETIRQAIHVGAVGGNIEDFTGDGAKPLFDVALATERIQAARLAADSTNLPFVLTARTNCYLVNYPNPFAAAVERANRYCETGADCIFVPGIKDLATIAQLVKEIPKPLTVVVGLMGAPFTVQQLADIGVRRITLGGSLARATYYLIRKAAQEMMQQGSFSYAEAQIPDGELCEFFANFGSK